MRAMRAHPFLHIGVVLGAAGVALAAVPAAAATGRPLAGVSCDTPPPVHCALDGCTREQLGNQGNAKEPKSGRAFFRDYPCDLKPGDPVVFILSLHGAGSTCDINFIFTSGEKEITGLPESSPWGEKYGCNPRVHQKDIVDTTKGSAPGGKLNTTPLFRRASAKELH
jgi:hypothetical protein